MRVILDTNVLLGALISPYGQPHGIYLAWMEGKFELITSEAQLDELRRVSRYPKLKNILPAHRVGTLINNLQRAIVLELLPDLENDPGIRDENDAFLIAMALESQSDYLVTGDKHAGIFNKKHVKRTRILTPSDFCREVLG